ncbi:MAG: phosphoribosylanthranilate isomerase [Bauldia sp.]|uniref:phosphoribosylanthranilate isomerase n=1 Tax=Bauldia sp. TaxID=2575872 RepID=UPI001DC2E468|nr:phosphoribosylanthranilate isomerase [Bauldia sp.]MCB1496408.1 phosphoribosylanthranilate isomerase [Bauldia sp.]
MSLIVKICGLSSRETVDAAIDAGADMIGLVFFGRSPRFVTMEDAAGLADHARGRAAIVGLTVNLDDAELSALVERVRPDWLQLHGTEPVDRVAAIRGQFPQKVIKALGIRGRDDLPAIDDFAGVSDRILLDAKAPAGSDRPGGNGEPFDWTLLKDIRPRVDWLLSGGLDAGNVAEALRITGAPGVDVSSGVENAPGRKDPEKIRAFIAAARGTGNTATATRKAS